MKDYLKIHDTIGDTFNEVYEFVVKNKDKLTVEELWEFDLLFYNIMNHAKGTLQEIRKIKNKKKRKGLDND